MFGTSLKEELEHRGISRRDFLGFCGSMAAVLGLPASAEIAIAQAVETERKPISIWLEFQDCAGNTESFLRATHPTVADLILDRFHSTITKRSWPPPDTRPKKRWRRRFARIPANISPWSRAPFRPERHGAYCTIGGRSALQIAREVCGAAAATIAVGTCAAFGGIPAAGPNPTGALSSPMPCRA